MARRREATRLRDAVSLRPLTAADVEHAGDVPRAAFDAVRDVFGPGGPPERASERASLARALVAAYMAATGPRLPALDDSTPR